MKVSATTPCPAIAASPCINNPETFEFSLSPTMVCFARILPATTGFTASKCEGFAAILT